MIIDVNKAELKLVWVLIRNCLGKLGEINKDSTWLKYLDVGSRIKEEYSKFIFDLKLAAHNGQDWRRLPIEYIAFYNFVVSLLERTDVIIEELPTSILFDSKYFQIKTEDYHVFWSKKTENADSFRVHKDSYDKFIEVLKDLANEYLGTQINLTCLQNADGALNFRQDKFLYVENQLGKDYAAKIKKYNEHGLGRTILFYGPPGTGKSNLAKSIGKELGTKTLSISNLDYFFSNYSKVLNDILDFLEIKCIIMDDLDSLTGNRDEVVLKKLEELRNSGKTVIGTANEIKTLKASFIRPGRFDEIKEIKYLDPLVVMELVDNDQELFEVIYQHPAASIQELMNRVKVLGKEAALAEIEDIICRGQALNESDYQLK